MAKRSWLDAGKCGALAWHQPAHVPKLGKRSQEPSQAQPRDWNSVEDGNGDEGEDVMSHATCPPDADVFWQKVPYWLSPDECWPWMGTVSDKGYGLHRFAGRTMHAHRRSWELFHGRPANAGLHACHACDFHACANPHHVWLGSHAENSRDASRKGLVAIGREAHLTTWVLIIGLYLVGDRGGVGIAAHEFTSEEACRAAGKAMATEWGRGGLSLRDQSRWVCVKK